MPVYEYRALDIRGKKLKGIINAESLFAARQKLRDTNIFPVELRETQVTEKDGPSSKKSMGTLFKRVSLSEISSMIRQLATLLGGGLPLIPSLTVLVSQTDNSQLKKTLAQIKEQVNEGNSLAQSISYYPRIFSPFSVNMVRAGEASGTLDIVLARLADYTENQQTLKGKMRAALAYPVFTFFVGCIVIFFLTTFIVPQITGIFDDMHQTLPGITLMLIWVSNFFKSFWLLVLIAMGTVFFGLKYAFTKTLRGQYVRDTMKLKIPLAGPVMHKMALARFSQTLGTLLQSGVPLLTALSIVKNVVNNRLMAEVIENAGKEIEEGKNLSEPLSRSTLFPPVTVQMISVGEQSGTLEAMLFKLAEGYENEVTSDIMTITSMLEPVMILIIGLFALFIVVSILLPIYEMNQLIR